MSNDPTCIRRRLAIPLVMSLGRSWTVPLTAPLMAPLVAITLVLAAGPLAGPAGASEPAQREQAAPRWPLPEPPAPDRDKSVSELAREGANKFLQALDTLARSIPQYALPEINEHGDIIIRRKNPPVERPKKDDLEPDMDRTAAREI